MGTGANGANQHLSVCRSLRISGKSITVVALCGNNSKLRRQLVSFGKSEGMKILALPKIDATGMFFLLSKTKCLFARPGAGMTSEALACGTPIIFNSCGGIINKLDCCSGYKCYFPPTPGPFPSSTGICRKK